MRSGPPVPPKDSFKTPLTSEGRLKRDPTHSYQRISATTNNTSSKELNHPHQAYAEHNQDQVLPEVVPGTDNHAADSYEKIPVAVNKSQHGAYPEVSYAEFNHGGTLPQAQLELENYPHVYNESLPEPLNRDRQPPYALDTKDETTPTRTICGLRRLWFWIILAAVILIAAIVAIVGGVLGSRAARKAKEDTSFLPTGALAAVNYTEGNGVQHRRLYFQGESNALYQSAWNSSTQEWKVSPLNPRDDSEPTVRPGTPLAAYTVNDGIHAAIEYHIFFLDTDNKIWERGSYDPDDMWGEQTPNTLNGTLFAGNNSKLAAYAQQCDRYCVQTSLVAYEDYESKLWWAAYISDYGWYAQAAKADSNHSLVTGSSLSLAPIWKNDSSLVALYANTGTLTRFWWYQLTAWEDSWSYDQSFKETIDPNAGIASFSLGYNGGNDTMSDIEVLVNEPGTDGGTTVWDSDFSNRTFSNNSAAASTFSSTSDFATIAASSGGRVYAVEGEHIVEWEWQHGNRSFVRLGTVNTDLNS